jgi:phosphoglycerate-specific signal transduction histidine kinase
MANDLAHQINNPLQTLTNLLFIAKQSSGIGDEKSLALKLENDFERLSSLTKTLLELPTQHSK